VSTVLFRMMGLIVRVRRSACSRGRYTVGKIRRRLAEQLLRMWRCLCLRSRIFDVPGLGHGDAARRVSILKFLSYMREELTIVLATASSDAVLPQIMRKLDAWG